MKKLNLWLLLSLFVAAFTLSACGSDDDNTPPPPASLAGTVWYETESSQPGNNIYVTWEFDNSGNAHWGNLVKNQGKWEKWVRHSYKYTVSGNKFTRTSGEGLTMTGTYVIEGDVLKITVDGQQNVIQMTRISGDLLKTYNTLTDNNNNDDDETLTVTEETLKGTWDGSVEADFAQGYYQRWRLTFDGKNYTSWHTHLTAGTINDEVQGVKTVGNKEQGTWEYKDGKLILTPAKQWASYYLTAKSLNDPYYTVYYNYNPETMEADQWYETPEALIKAGIERDLEDGINGNEFTISAWSVVGLTKTELSVKINMDTFKLKKQ